jgi:hypothetical protein
MAGAQNVIQSHPETYQRKCQISPTLQPQKVDSQMEDTNEHDNAGHYDWGYGYGVQKKWS